MPMIPQSGRASMAIRRPVPRPPAAAPQQAPGLARQTYNPGSRGQNSRYDVRGLERGERGFTDGVYWYDENGLSLDRPDAVIGGLRAADEMDGREAWDSGIAGALSQAAPPYPLPGPGPTSFPGMDALSGLATGQGELPPWGYEGQAPSAADWTQREGFYESDNPSDALAMALASQVERIPGRAQRGGRARSL